MKRYTRSTDWTIGIKIHEKKKVFYLENRYKGLIIIDEQVQEILSSIRGQTLEEIYQFHRELLENVVKEINVGDFNIQPLQLLNVILSIFACVGVIVIDNEMAINRQSLQEPEIPLLKNHPLVSVIVVNYNGIHHLPELLDSLMSQSYPYLEIIVIDNGSTDNSADLIRENYSHVKLFHVPENLGHGEAFNIAMGYARGDLILHLDNDIVMGPHTVYQLVEAAQDKKQWAALAPKLKFYHNRAFINSLGNSIHKHNWGI